MRAAAASLPARITPEDLSSPAIAAPVDLRTAVPADAPAIHALIEEHREAGRLLPRNLSEIVQHVHRFAVACSGDGIVASAELAPLSRQVAEVRSLVVATKARDLEIGTRIVVRLTEQATAAGFVRLCAFTHAPSFFVRLGFSIVPHVWVPEKILTDCHVCPHFRRCGQYAVARLLRGAASFASPAGPVHG